MDERKKWGLVLTAAVRQLEIRMKAIEERLGMDKKMDYDTYYDADKDPKYEED